MEREKWAERKTGLTSNQKAYLREMWAEYLPSGIAVCIFPKFVVENLDTNPEDIYMDCLTEPIELHHIVPQGYCKRVLNQNPDVPWNVAPICAEHHRIGQKDKPLTRAMQECIHIDAAWATKSYRGKTKPTSFDKVFEQRKKITDRGEKYWFDLWDEYLLGEALAAYTQFVERHPDYEWPERY